MDKRSERRKAQLEAAHHAEMGEHAEAVAAEAKAEVLTTELLAEQANRMGEPAPTIALEQRVAELETTAAELEAQEDGLTRRIVAAQVEGRAPDPADVATRRDVRERRTDLAEVLPVLRSRLEEGRAATAIHRVTDWLTTHAAPDAHAALARRTDALERIAALERDLAAARQSAAADYERAKFCWDAAHVLHEAFGFELPAIAHPGQKPEALHGSPSELERLDAQDDLAGACRAIPPLARDLSFSGDFGGWLRLADAIEHLLHIRTPKLAEQRNAERREAVDRPHKEAIARVDAWIAAELASGPVPYPALAERAGAAAIPLHAGEGQPGWGHANVAEAAQRVGAYAVVAYKGSNEEDLAAAAQWQDGVTYWTTRAVKGLMVPPAVAKDAAMGQAMRS